MSSEAPRVLPQGELPGAQPLPRLSTGQDIYAAETSAAQGLAQAETAGARSLAQAQEQSMAAEVAFSKSLSQDVNSVALAVANSQRRTDLTERKTAYFKGLEEDLQTAKDDPDWKGAKQRYDEAVAKRRGTLLAGVDGGTAAELDSDTLVFTRSGQREVTGHVASKTTDAARAARDEATPTMLATAARAGSATERQGTIDQFDRDTDAEILAGHYTAQEGYVKKLQFRQQLDLSDLTRGVKDRPDQTLKALADPAMFPTLQPYQRETYRNQAQAAIDERRGLEATDAARRNPTAAVATYSRNIPPDQVPAIYAQTVAPIAGADARSTRAYAREIGRPDLVNLTDAELAQKLAEDPGLARQTGLARFRDDLQFFDGSLPAAIAAQHGGRGGVGKYVDQAKEKFGDNFTAAQLASLLPDSVGRDGMTTADYLTRTFRQIGADPERGGVSPNAARRIGSAVDNVVAGDRAEAMRNLKALVSNSDDERDAVIQSFKSGYATDPAAVQAAKAPLIAAASAGDAGAAQKLRQFSELEALAPIVRQAYGLPPEQLEAAVADLRQRAATHGASAADLRRLDVFGAVATETASARSTNPVGLAERGGRVPLTVVPVPQDVRDPAFAAALSSRAAAAEGANRLFGGDLKVLKPEETVAHKARFAEMQPDERAGYLETAARSMPAREYEALVGQVAGTDSLARTAGTLGRQDPQLARDILRGQVLLEQPGVKPKVAEVRDALREKLPSDVYPAAVQGDMIEASLAVYAADKGKTGSLFDRSDRSGIERAVARVAGEMVKVNGRYAPVPAGTPTRDLYDGWRNLDQGTLDRSGGAVGRDGTPFDPAFLARNAVLKPLAAGGGSYAVILPQGTAEQPVMNLDGRPLTVTLSDLVAGLRSRERGSSTRPAPRVARPAAAGAEMVPSE